MEIGEIKKVVISQREEIEEKFRKQDIYSTKKEIHSGWWLTPEV